jgi:hypothetical protein
MYTNLAERERGREGVRERGREGVKERSFAVYVRAVAEPPML